MLCWLTGLPSRVRAWCHFGKYHRIEVEDEVTAYLEYPDGATGVFVTSTGEAPGTNRLEVAGELGKVVFENDRLTFFRNAIGMTEFSRTTSDRFAAPEVSVEEFSGLTHGDQHLGILRNFIEAIRKGAPLIAPASDGLASVELANAMLLSSFTHRAVDLPIDAEVYAKELRERIAQSAVIKTENAEPASDMTGSFR